MDEVFFGFAVSYTPQCTPPWSMEACCHRKIISYEFVDVGFFSRCEGMAHHLRTLWGIFRVVRHTRNLLKFCPSVCGGCNVKVEALEAVKRKGKELYLSV